MTNYLRNRLSLFCGLNPHFLRCLPPTIISYMKIATMDSDYYPQGHYHSSHHKSQPRDSMPKAHSHHHSGHGHDHGNYKESHHQRRHDHQKHHDPHHGRHLAEGAIAGAGIAEVIHHHRKKEGDDVSHGLGHIVRTVGAGALGAVAAHELSRARDSHHSKSSHSPDGHHNRHGHSHHRH